MRLKSITKIDPAEARCIEVEAPDRLFAAGGTDGKSIISHNSVIQRNIVMGCIMRPESWYFAGIDLKRVELSAYRAYSNVVIGIATTIEDALLVLRFAQETMMSRYTNMEELGVNNFLDLPEKGRALMVMVDEAGELLSPTGAKALSHKTVVPNKSGRANLGEIQIGDVLFDNHGKETIVTNKYEPVAQQTYSVTVKKDSTGAKEMFIAGEEHNWVVFIDDEELLMTTEELFELRSSQSPDKRSEIRFRRAKNF